MKQSTLGSCIRTMRMHNNMTQAQLAEKLGVTDKAVSKWERNLSYPDITLFPKLADVLGVAVDDLLRGCNDNYRPTQLMQVFELSKDIRTPLHIMLGFVEMAKNNHEDSEKLLKFLEGIRVSGEYLMTLLDKTIRADYSSDSKGEYEDYPLTSEKLEQYLQEKIQRNPVQQEAFDFTGKRILVAEDMAVNREIAAEIIKRTGAETEFAENGAICVEKVEAAPAGYFDLILMDIVMPQIDGIEATKKIRQLPDPEKAQIPIIAMTTNVSDQDRKAAFSAGMNDFMEKPVFVEKLFETMERYLHECLLK